MILHHLRLEINYNQGIVAFAPDFKLPAMRRNAEIKILEWDR